MVLATQNPIEQEGTYPLPEAQLDRFLFKIRIDYPTARDESAAGRGRSRTENRAPISMSRASPSSVKPETSCSFSGRRR